MEQTASRLERNMPSLRHRARDSVRRIYAASNGTEVGLEGHQSINTRAWHVFLYVIACKE